MTALLRRGRVAAAILLVVVAALVSVGPASSSARTAVTLRASPDVFAARSPAVSAALSQTWGWPVSPPHQLQRPFEAPSTPFAAGHRGIDVTATQGEPVLAAADGVVSFAGVVVDRPVVSVRHGDGLVSSVEPVLAAVSAGAEVHSGEAIGVVASGGHCDGRCVHFGVRLYGEYVNPLALLGTLERAVLLPLGR